MIANLRMVGATLLLLAVPDVAAATLLFHGALVPPDTGTNVAFDPVNVSSGLPIFEQVAADDPTEGGSLSGAVSASYGHVGAESFTTVILSGGRAALQAEALFRDDQLIFHADDPSAFPSGTVPVSLNLVIAGQAATTVNGQVNLALYVSINDALVGTMTRDLFNISNTIIGDNCGGTLPGDCHDLVYTTVTSEISVPLDSPVSIQLDLSLTTGVIDLVGATASGDYLHSVDFPVGTDLFNLPAGVTVNEPGAYIFDNHFVPVPEPATFWLFGAGIILLRDWRRKLTSACQLAESTLGSPLGSQ